MKRYRLRKTGSLLITKAALTGPQGTKILNLLIDTGSTYTIVPTEALEATGCSPAESKEHIRIITGSGTILAPLVKISKFECLGHKITDFKILAHTLPPESAVDGLLGMDFLRKHKARIDTYEEWIEIH